MKSHLDEQKTSNEKIAEAALLSLIGLQIDTQSHDDKIDVKNEVYAQILNDFKEHTCTENYRFVMSGSEGAALAMIVLMESEIVLVDGSHEFETILDDGSNDRYVTPYNLASIQAAINYTKALIHDRFGDEINPENNKVVVQMEGVLRDLRFEVVQGVVLAIGESDKNSLRSKLDDMLEYVKHSKHGFTDEDKAYFWKKIRDSLTYKDQKDDLLAVVVNHKIFKSSGDGKLFSKPSATFERMRAEMKEMKSAEKAAQKDKAAAAVKKH